ncbi:non-lysosomal glucosylceramidase [Echinicola sediminis]
MDKKHHNEPGYNKKPKPVPFDRRDFIRSMGLVAGGLATGFPSPVRAKSEAKVQWENPADKKLDPAWIKSLYERGKEEVYSGKELSYIGMPVGGITAGQVYVGGDGKLWLWHIFNKQHNGVTEKTVRFDGKKLTPRNGTMFVSPLQQKSPVRQGFKIQVGDQTKTLDKNGFSDITFKGQYPIAKVNYKEDQFPVEVSLLSFSPFIPLDWDASSYPATVAKYTLKNTGKNSLSCTLTGWLENAVHLESGDALDIKLRNRLITTGKETAVVMDAPPSMAKTNSPSFEVKNQPDHGSMALLLRNADENTRFSLDGQQQEDVKGTSGKELISDLGDRPVSSLSQEIHLEPGEEKSLEFIISWYFPNLYPQEGRDFSYEFKGRYYSSQFKDASEVALDLSSRYEELESKTLLWVKTYYENATLPHWFLNRTFINTSILATETSYRLEDGRFWAWEGVGCCPGTCTHVWHYEQAMGRIFPEIERNLREQTDFKVMDKESGKIDFRAGLANRDAADGQAGIVMRAYRDHQTSRDHTFLKNNWDNIKLSLKYLIDMDKEDGEANGMIYGEQHNTLDAEWYGNIPVITSLYLSALACGLEMAKEMDDDAFEKECSTILEKGKKNIEGLFNEEYGYFVQKEDPNHSGAIGIGTGCYIDQVFGQGWAFQVGLGRIFSEELNKKALDSLWKHNFMTNMGAHRSKLPPNLAGRPYALEGDAGLIMCTWPNGGRKSDWEKHWQYGYFNECMTGFEYQAASHMVWEGKDLLEKGLAITKAIHDRYHPSMRNPYNEIECSDHYARAMASYGVYTAACGFEYHGPKGYLAFNPRWQQDDFKAAFTAAEGWGSFVQKREKQQQENSLEMAFGKLDLTDFAFQLPEGKRAKSAVLKVDGKRLKVKGKTDAQGRYTWNLGGISLREGQQLSSIVEF